VFAHMHAYRYTMNNLKSESSR